LPTRRSCLYWRSIHDHQEAGVFCSHCGAAAGGNFCSACGAALKPAAAQPAAAAPAVLDPVAVGPVAVIGPNPPPVAAAWVPTAAGVWDDEVRYSVVLAIPEVRGRIAANTAAASTRMSGEQFLELCDKALKPFTGVSVATVAAIALPIYTRLGVHTGKAEERTIERPVGRVLADVLCFLAASGYGVKRVQQGADGCVLECTLPSDWRAFAGELVVTVERCGPAVAVRAATRIGGQLYDWGKSRQVLDRLFNDLTRP